MKLLSLPFIGALLLVSSGFTAARGEPADGDVLTQHNDIYVALS
jgi:hypothetical protein